MRFYSVAVASLAISAPNKWLDNLLSQHVIPDVAHRRRGAARGVSWQALVHIALTRQLHDQLGCGVRDAVHLAGRLLDSPPGTPVHAGPVALLLDRETLERDLHARLREALESAPSPRRGRPPAKGRREG